MASMRLLALASLLAAVSMVDALSVSEVAQSVVSCRAPGERASCLDVQGRSFRVHTNRRAVRASTAGTQPDDESPFDGASEQPEGGAGSPVRAPVAPVPESDEEPDAPPQPNYIKPRIVPGLHSNRMYPPLCIMTVDQLPRHISSSLWVADEPEHWRVVGSSSLTSSQLSHDAAPGTVRKTTTRVDILQLESTPSGSSEVRY